MADLVRCVDRWGRVIVLAKARWDDHILPGHPALVGHEASVEIALTGSDFVNFDTYRGSRENYYRTAVLPPPHHHTYPKVVVQFRRTGSQGPFVGEVITAFPTHRVKPGEVRKWP